MVRNNNVSSHLWLAVIITAVIVAVVASLITANITGNTVKVQKNLLGPTVYTKAEIDKKFNNITIGDAIFERLSKYAEPSGQYWITGPNSPDVNGDDICGQSNGWCIFGYGGAVFPGTTNFNFDANGIFDCQTTFGWDELLSGPDWQDGATFVIQYLCVDRD